MVVGRKIVAVLLLVSAGCSSNDTQKEEPPRPAPVWAADETLLPALAPAVNVEDYEIRPPQGYLLAMRERGTTRAFVWQGAKRADMSTPQFWVMIGRMTAEEKSQTLEETVGLVTAGARHKLEDYTETAGERGALAGLTFLRMSFRGVERGPVPFRGQAVVYHAHDGARYIHIMLMDSEPHHLETWPLLETAARSFRKR